MPVNDFTVRPLAWTPRAPLARPRYLSLAAALEGDVRSGALPPGAPLPPQRLLADFLDLNFTTVTRAYDLCREKGLVRGETGRGTFVAERPAAADDGGAALELGVVLGFPTLNAHLADAARAVLSRPERLERLFSYADRAGSARARAAGARWLARFGVDVPAARVSVFAGAQGAITAALLSLFRAGEGLAVDAYTYSNLIGAARLAHVPLVPVAGDDAGMRPDALDAVCRAHRVTGVFLMPNVANPTAVTIPDARRDDLAAVCRRRALTVIEDDAAPRPPPAACRPFCARLPDQTLYIAAATRHAAPGLRATFATFPARFGDVLTRGLYHTSIKAGALDAAVLSEAVLSGGAEKALAEKHVAAVRANRVFNRLFPDAPRVADKGAYFRLLPLAGRAHDGPAWERRLAAAGVKVCAAHRFAVSRTPRRAFLRLSLSSEKSLAALTQALEIVKRTVGAGRERAIS